MEAEEQNGLGVGDGLWAEQRGGEGIDDRGGGGGWWASARVGESHWIG